MVKVKKNNNLNFFIFVLFRPDFIFILNKNNEDLS